MIFDSDRRYDNKADKDYFSNQYEKENAYTPEEAIKILITDRMFTRIKECIKNNGLERTENMIKETYNRAPKLREKLLLTLYEIWKG